MNRTLAALAAVLALAACGREEPEPAQEEAPAEAGTAPEVAAPAPPPAPATGTARDVESWLAGNYGDMGHIVYDSGMADLNGDGLAEVLTYVGGPMVCGTGGCNLVILQQTTQGLRQMAEISVAQLPVGVMETSTNGWRDLAVSVGGGGGQSGIARVPFTGESYAGNPTVPPAEMSGAPFQTVIADGQLRQLAN